MSERCSRGAVSEPPMLERASGCSGRASTKGRDDELASARYLHDLVDRIEIGTGPDREIDCLVAQVVLGATHDGQPEPYRKWTLTARDGAKVTGSDPVMIRPFTDSLDVVVSLIEQKLPGWCWQTKRAIGCEAIVWQVCKDYDDEGCKTIGFHMSSAPRALLAACLRALQANLPEHADATPKNPLSEGRERS